MLGWKLTPLSERLLALAAYPPTIAFSLSTGETTLA